MRLAGVIAIVLVSVFGLFFAARGASLRGPEETRESGAAPANAREAPAGGGAAAAPSPERPSLVSPEASPTTTQQSAHPDATPAAEPSPTGSPSATDHDLLALLSAMADKIDTIRDAIRDNDSKSLLRAQHELLADIRRARELVQQDESGEAEKVRDALNSLESGLSGDLAKLDGAARELHKATQVVASARGVSLGPRPDRISDLERFAKNAARKVDNFQRAVEASEPSRLMRLQGELLHLTNDGLASLRNSRSPQAEKVKSALEDIKEGLPSDLQRLESARLKLLEAAGETSEPTPTPTKPAQPGAPGAGTPPAAPSSPQAATPVPTPGPR